MVIKPIYRLILLLLGSGFLVSNIAGQETVASQGEEVIFGKVNYTFTVGESIIGTLANANFFLSQGFNQPRKLFINSVETNSFNEFLVYPNPTLEVLTLECSNPDFDIYLYDCTGKMIPVFLRRISDQKFILSISDLPSGLYLLMAITSNKELISKVRIVKQ